MGQRRHRGEGPLFQPLNRRQVVYSRQHQVGFLLGCNSNLPQYGPIPPRPDAIGWVFIDLRGEDEIALRAPTREVGLLGHLKGHLSAQRELHDAEAAALYPSCW